MLDLSLNTHNGDCPNSGWTILFYYYFFWRGLGNNKKNSQSRTKKKIVHSEPKKIKYGTISKKKMLAQPQDGKKNSCSEKLSNPLPPKINNK